jgi:hypothetical protein
VRLDSVRAADAAAAAARAARARARSAVRHDTLAVRQLRGPVRVCAGGDVTLGTNLDTAWARKAAKRMRKDFRRDDAPRTLLAPLRSLVSSADIVLLNIESAIGSGRTGAKCGRGSRNCYAFRSPPSSAPALRALAPGKAIVGNVANNHALDAGARGRDSTIAALARVGIFVTGADTLATPVPTPAGDTIGVLGFYTSNEMPDARDTAAVYRHVARASERYPVVIATMHLGAEGRDAQRTADSTEIFLGIDRGNPVAFAEAAVRGGRAHGLPWPDGFSGDGRAREPDGRDSPARAALGEPRQPPVAPEVESALVSTRRAPRQILISGEGARSMSLSMTRPATLLACTYRPLPM